MPINRPTNVAGADDEAISKSKCIEIVGLVARAIDRCDAELLSSQFHPDATDDHGIFKGSAKDFIAWVIPLLRTMELTQHVIGQSLIELDGDTAFGESYFTAHHEIQTPDGRMHMIAAGRYLDRFERRQGTWKIAHREAVYDWDSMAPSTMTYHQQAPDGMAVGSRTPSDPSYNYLART